MTRRRILIGGGVSAVVIIGLLAFGFWWFLIRDDAPLAVSLADAVSSLSDETPSATTAGNEGTPQPQPTTPAAEPEPTQAAGAAVTVDGT